MVEFSVVMPSYLVVERLIELTKEAIDSIGNGDTELILIDNASPIGGGFLRSKAHVYIRNRENLGFAKAVNQGIKLARGRYIAIANNDIRVSPNWKAAAKEALDFPRVFSVHPRMTNYDEPFAYGHTLAFTGKERWCTGSFFVTKASIRFLYDEDFLNSYDDWDLFYRVRKAGYKTAYTDKACYQHAHSFTQALIPEREVNNERNRELFKKNHGAYAEDLFAAQYPDQMAVPYERGFAL